MLSKKWLNREFSVMFGILQGQSMAAGSPYSNQLGHFLTEGLVPYRLDIYQQRMMRATVVKT